MFNLSKLWGSLQNLSPFAPDYRNNQILKELVRLMKEKAANGEIPTQEWVNQMRPQTLKNVLPIKDYQLGKRFTDGMNGLLYNAVLNKKQY